MILMLTTKYEEDAEKLKLCSRHIVFAFLYGKSSKYLRSVLLLSFYAFNFLLWSMNSIPTIAGDWYGDGDNKKTMWITIKITNDALPITIEITIYQLQITIEISARTSRSPLWRTSGTTSLTSTQPSSFISSLFFIIPSIGGLSKKTHLSYIGWFFLLVCPKNDYVPDP